MCSVRFGAIFQIICNLFREDCCKRGKASEMHADNGTVKMVLWEREHSALATCVFQIEKAKKKTEINELKYIPVAGLANGAPNYC